MSEVSVLEGAGSIRRTRMKNANQVTGANSGESRLLPMRARCAAPRRMAPRCFQWNHFRVRAGELTPERCLEFGHFPAVCCCSR